MMLEISQKLKEPLAVAVTGTSTPTSSGHAPPSTGGTHIANLPEKETAGEVPSVMPIIVNLDPPPKEDPTPHLSEESEKRLAKMEERLCALQSYALKGVDRFSSYTKTNFLEIFQESRFTRKYDGAGCPTIHLRYYLRKMARYADNVSFLIHTFQDSLEDIALMWFIVLGIEKFTSWEDLANEFLQQYRFNTELTLTREELTHIEKKMNESFKAFAQRWRTMASQIEPRRITRPTVAAVQSSLTLLGHSFLESLLLTEPLPFDLDYDNTWAQRCRCPSSRCYAELLIAKFPGLRHKSRRAACWPVGVSFVSSPSPTQLPLLLLNSIDVAYAAITA
ncbi:uncharacterized protein LOC120293666 [Eucalyptus grandis]|uniref:uncharacterized protein LOC120293666 n=1 Tax=Eucalyptus grandis TaxID=71139 RepID=UPI00192F0B9C|nr:uncharacterized protein LOC120293666 [Eucalyptus grandis]